MSFLRTSARQAFINNKQLFVRSTIAKRYLTATPLKQNGKSVLAKRVYTTTSNQSIPSPKIEPPKTFTWKSAVVLVITAIGLVAYFKNEKEKLSLVHEKREREKIRALGRPHIGAPFTLLNANTGRAQTSDDLMNGQFTLVYFGFTHCPDICPEELDKMAEVVENTKTEFGEGIVTPVFITCDPLRDTPELVKEYVQDFHPTMVGFTGSGEDLKKVARSYRVYSYTPPNVKKEDDYLVDHSIYIYLMDPQGQFMDCYGRDKTVEEIYESFRNYFTDYLQDGGKLKYYDPKNSSNSSNNKKEEIKK